MRGNVRIHYLDYKSERRMRGNVTVDKQTKILLLDYKSEGICEEIKSKERKEPRYSEGRVIRGRERRE